MREHFFRAQRCDNKEWVYGFYMEVQHVEDKSHIHSFILVKEKCLEIGGLQDFMVEVIPETVCEWSGLIDKNGKRIFEGDVLAREGYWRIRIEYELGGLVVRDFDIVRYINQCTNSSLRHYPNLSEYEVISNIHDNPELLEG